MKIFMLNSYEYEIKTAHKARMLQLKTFLAFNLSDVVLTMLINFNIFMSMIS